MAARQNMPPGGPQIDIALLRPVEAWLRVSGSDPRQPSAVVLLCDFYQNRVVFLDSIFYPQLDNDLSDIQCHRLEFEDDDISKPLVHSGICYNELLCSIDGESIILDQGRTAHFSTSPGASNSPGCQCRRVTASSTYPATATVICTQSLTSSRSSPRPIPSSTGSPLCPGRPTSASWRSPRTRLDRDFPL